MRREHLRRYMQQLCDRMRNVRVCCGDWKRVTGPTVTFRHGVTAVFLDPPYLAETEDGQTRDANIYRCEDTNVAREVREWAIEAGKNPLMRIALCGYEGEHEMPSDWDCFAWKANGGYGVINGNGEYENKHRERIWFGPSCVRERTLFSAHA